MARNEARIFTSIWKDKDFLCLPPSAQRLYMFLLSQDDLTYSGVMPLRERRWAAKAAGLTAADVEQDLKALEVSDRRFVITDRDTGELLVRSLIRRDGVWKQPNLLKLARDSVKQVESQRIRAALLVELRRLPLRETGSGLVREVVADFINDLVPGTADPTANPADDPTADPTDDPTANPADDPTANPADDPTADPSADPSGKAPQGYGESNVRKLVSPNPRTPGTPKPLTDLPASSTRGRKNGTRLPDDFVVDDGMRAWARTECPHVNPDDEFKRFADYWRAKPGKDACKLDWLATWRNWMRNAEDRQKQRSRASPNGHPPPRGGAAADLSGEVYGKGKTRI